jgi:hypothetical protein
VNDEQAVRILLADNRTSDKATYDNNRLAELLSELAVDSDQKLVGTGYSAQDLDELVRDLARAATPPEPDKPKAKGEERFALVMLFDDEAEREEAYREIKDLGLGEPRKTLLNERTQLAVG